MNDGMTGDVSVLLRRWVAGDAGALSQLTPLVYDELRRLARQQLRGERAGHTLQSTALVNEAFVRLLGSQPGQVENREHFVALAARLMRQILVDHARRRQAGKRDGGLRVGVSALEDVAAQTDQQFLALDEALEELSRHDERQAQVVEMRFFGGLTAPEVARVMGVSLTTVERDWAVARLWLRRRMGAIAET